MKIEKWLSDVYYDEWGTHIWNKDKDGGSQLVADVRGWGAIQQIFKTHKECVQFQNEVGKFIVEAIREKIERTNSIQIDLTDTQLKELADKGFTNTSQFYNPLTDYTLFNQCAYVCSVVCTCNGKQECPNRINK
jgi:hypothetical protein